MCEIKENANMCNTGDTFRFYRNLFLRHGRSNRQHSEAGRAQEMRVCRTPDLFRVVIFAVSFFFALLIAYVERFANFEGLVSI